MPGLSFKPRFERPIHVGTKRHTIRGNRKRPFREGDALFLWVSMRTKGRRFIGYTIARSVEDVAIDLDVVPGRLAITIDGQRLSWDEANRLAVADGFRHLREMHDFWMENNALPFEGQIVHWFYPLRERPATLKSRRKKGSIARKTLNPG
jgi:hypothetical protein